MCTSPITTTDVDEQERTVADLDGTWWWCMKHARPEKYEETDSPDRLGPFSTQDEAAHALRTIADREDEYARQEDDDA